MNLYPRQDFYSTDVVYAIKSSAKKNSRKFQKNQVSDLYLLQNDGGVVEVGPEIFCIFFAEMFFFIFFPHGNAFEFI